MTQISALLHDANQAREAGDSRSAAAKFLAVHRLMPNEMSVLRDLVFVTAEFDRSQSVKLLDDYIDRQPHKPGGRLHALELQLPYVESIERHKRGLDPYSATDPWEPQLQFCGAKLDQFIDLSDRFGGLAYEALSAFVQGNYALTDRCLESMGRRSIDPRIGNVRFTGSWFDDIEDAADHAIAALPPVRWLSDGAYPTAFIGCDPAFYREYGANLIKSAADEPVHFHCFGQELNSASSVELPPVGADRFYYAAIRLCRLHQLMERDPRPLLMLDADLLVSGPLKPVYEMLVNADVAVCRMPGRLQYHTQYNASVLGIAPTAAGRRFLKRAAGFVWKVWQTGNIPWCLDQLAIHCILRNMALLGIAPVVKAVGPSVYNGSFDCLLVPQKVSKFSPDYPKYRDALAKLEGN